MFVRLLSFVLPRYDRLSIAVVTSFNVMAVIASFENFGRYAYIGDYEINLFYFFWLLALILYVLFEVFQKSKWIGRLMYIMPVPFHFFLAILLIASGGYYWYDLFTPVYMLVIFFVLYGFYVYQANPRFKKKFPIQVIDNRPMPLWGAVLKAVAATIICVALIQFNIYHENIFLFSSLLFYTSVLGRWVDRVAGLKR